MKSGQRHVIYKLQSHNMVPFLNKYTVPQKTGHAYYVS